METEGFFQLEIFSLLQCEVDFSRQNSYSPGIDFSRQNSFSAGIDFSRQILTTKVDPRTEKVNTERYIAYLLCHISRVLAKHLRLLLDHWPSIISTK